MKRSEFDYLRFEHKNFSDDQVKKLTSRILRKKPSELSFYNCQFDCEIEQLINYDGLKKLVFESCHVKTPIHMTKFVQRFNQHTRLEHLNLRFTRVPKFACIDRLANLTLLDVSWTTIDYESAMLVFDSIKTHRVLKELHIRDPRYGEKGEKELVSVLQLLELQVFSGPLPECIDLGTAFASLTSFESGYIRSTLVLANALRCASNMQHLILTSVNIALEHEEELLEAVSQMKELRTFKLFCAAREDLIAKVIANNPNLQKLSITTSEFEGIQQIATQVSRTSNLRSLCIQFKQECGLFVALQSHKNLKKLSVKNCNIQWKDFCDSLKEYHQLKSLRLCQNKIKVEDAKMISDSLPPNLNVLHVNRCGMTKDALFELQKSKSITLLYLSQTLDRSL